MDQRVSTSSDQQVITITIIIITGIIIIFMESMKMMMFHDMDTKIATSSNRQVAVFNSRPAVVADIERNTNNIERNTNNIERNKNNIERNTNNFQRTTPRPAPPLRVTQV